MLVLTHIMYSSRRRYLVILIPLALVGWGIFAPSKSMQLLPAFQQAVVDGNGSRVDDKVVMNSVVDENGPRMDDKVIIDLDVDIPAERLDPRRDVMVLSWTQKKLRLRDPTCSLLPPKTRCILTTNRKLENISDAIYIHMRGIRNVNMLPKHRKRSQKWIFFENEPPTKTWSYLPKLDTNAVRGLFNLTLTFTQDASITVSPFRCERDQRKYAELSGVNFAAGKTRNVAWFASHCDTPNKREDYVHELSKHIDVDIYGTCGPLSCGNRSRNAEAKKECDQVLLNKHYKFYLSFENSFCEDYYTEKLTKIIGVNVIPVVMGYTNYTDIMPSDSFIDVRDYSSPKYLAQYLIEISNNDAFFNSYIQSQQSLVCGRRLESRACQICSYLYNNRNTPEMIPDVVDFWSPERRCLSKANFFNRNHTIIAK